MMGMIWVVLLVALTGSHLGHCSPLRSTPQTYPHDGHNQSKLDGWGPEGWYAAVPALALIVTAVGLLLGCTWCYRHKDCKLFTASATHLHDGRRAHPPDSGFSEPVNNNINEDNNNGPISLREMQNIANNNAAAYIVSENEERNRLSRESVVEFEPLPTGIRVADPLEHCADWFGEEDFPRNRLQYLREIGRGWFGRVVEGEIDDAGTTTTVAVKILNQNASLEDKARFLDEAKMYRDVRHENVLAFIAKCLQEDPWILIFELCSMDLQQYLVVNRPKMAILNESGVPLRLMCDVSAGLAHLHSRGYLYGSVWSGAVQVRGFKTERGIHADMKRNPNIINRLRLGAHDQCDNKQQAGPEVARLEKLLNEESQHLTHQQKDKIKIAFAEGYLAGSHPDNVRGTKASKYLKLVQQLLTIVLFLAIFVSLMASVSGTVFRIQLGNQVEVDPEDISVTFDDVKGADEAKQELKDVVEFLKSPEKFSSLGGKLPKGVLLVGPPGTGKTLLARAVAGEARVPFFHAAGPEFDEILVGQGARRVRDLFKAAKERAPCVIFIDEIDSVGAKRTNSVLHPYANQTINQLLSEMDGFHQNEGVIVLGATNRRDDLDQALLRPGRFDVEVNVPTPDYGGRREILELYLARVRAHAEVDCDVLARGTTGFTGADLENMVNQAALKAAIDGAKTVSMKYLEDARDKVLMGPERRSRLPDEEANTITAYHEGGHAIVAYYTKDSHPLHKVTIIPRGPSLGHTAYIPAKERYHVTKQQLLAMMDTMMGGRAAEELVFGPEKITSGASSDLKQATSIASHMVREWGMSEKVGLRTMDSSRGMQPQEQLGPYTNELVDGEIKKILSDSYDRAKAILRTHAKEHKALAEALLKYETLDADDIKAIMNGEKVKIERLGRATKDSSPSSAPSAPSGAGLLGAPHPAPA